VSKKTIYSTVIYDCKNFDIFIKDYLLSVFEQTSQQFELMLLIDDADEELVKSKVDEFNHGNIVVHVLKSDRSRKPVELRQELINQSCRLGAELLIFSDFDEEVARNRVEEVVKYLPNYEFVFNDFYIVNKNLERLSQASFFYNRNIPEEICDWHDIKSCNYIGYGSMAINLKKYKYENLVFPLNIQALDWFIATKVLMDGGAGFRINTTHANYRQHENSFVGFDFNLNEEKLVQGLAIKKSHYDYFRACNSDMQELYEGVLELEGYINEIGQEVYINKINENYDTDEFCWWENIKLKKELIHDI
jgi:hypothetical protein